MATETDTQSTCHPIEVTVDLRVELTPPPWAYGYRVNVKARHESLRAWARDLEDFLRDHRSQDAVPISIEPVVETQCSACRHQWEEYEGCCAWCGAQLEQNGDENGKQQGQ